MQWLSVSLLPFILPFAVTMQNKPNPQGTHLICKITTSSAITNCINENDYLDAVQQQYGMGRRDNDASVFTKLRGGIDSSGQALAVSDDHQFFVIDIRRPPPGSGTPGRGVVMYAHTATYQAPLDITTATPAELNSGDVTLRYGPPGGIGGAMCHDFATLDGCRSCCNTWRSNGLIGTGGMAVSCAAAAGWNLFGQIGCAIADAIFATTTLISAHHCDKNCVAFHDDSAVMPNGMTYHDLIAEPPQRGFVTRDSKNVLMFDETIRRTPFAGPLLQRIARHEGALIQLNQSYVDEIGNLVVNDFTVVPHWVDCKSLFAKTPYLAVVHWLGDGASPSMEGTDGRMFFAWGNTSQFKSLDGHTLFFWGKPICPGDHPVVNIFGFIDAGSYW